MLSSSERRRQTGKAEDDEVLCLGLRYQRVCVDVVQLHTGRTRQSADSGGTVKGRAGGSLRTQIRSGEFEQK